MLTHRSSCWRSESAVAMIPAGAVEGETMDRDGAGDEGEIELVDAPR